MGRGFTYKQVKKIIEKEGNKLISKEYKTTKIPLDVQCNECGTIYSIRLSSYRRGSRCRKCSNIKLGINRRTPIGNIIALMESRGDKLIDTFYIKNKLRVKFQCRLCSKIFTMMYFNYQRRRCCKCQIIYKVFSYDYVKKFIKDHGEKLVSKNITSSSDKMKVKCKKCNEIYTTCWHSYQRGVRCGLCSKYRKKTIDDVRKLVESGGDSLISTVYKNTISKLDAKCGKCSNIFKTTYAKYRQGNRCPKCSLITGISKITHSQEFVESYIDQYGDKLMSKYVRMDDKIDIKCGKCNEMFSMRFHSYKTNGCRCSCNTMSRGEREIYYYLITNNIKYTLQKTFKGCKNKIALRFDFYLPEYDLLIEFDGNGHFGEVDLFGGKKYFENKRKCDIIKNVFCIKNQKDLLRIPYTDIKNIESILDTYLTTDDHITIEYSSIRLYSGMIIETFKELM